MTPELKTAIKITKHVSYFLHANFQRFHHQKISLKKHAEIVTDFDIEANKYITEQILHKFPNHDIISEEAEKIDNPDTKTWYVDPLDGTTNFAFGFTEYGTCLGMADRGDIKLGVMSLPESKELYFAEKNNGAWCGKNKLAVSNKETLNQSLFLLCPGHSPEGKVRFKKYFAKLDLLNIHFRLLAAACVELTAVASGRADVCILSDVHTWDVVAGVILIREAGGRVTNFQGKDWQITDQTLIASNGTIHKEVLKLTKETV